jgi:hypothetical protein
MSRTQSKQALRKTSRQDLPLAELLRITPFSELLETWDAIDLKGTDIPAIRWLCLNDRFYLLVKVLRRYDAWHPWLYERCREVETAPDGYCDIWAREHYKSTIITFAGTIQEILRDREIKIGLFSHTKPIAKGFLSQIQRELETNENLKACFPEVLWANPGKQAPSWSLDGGLVVRRDGNPKEATIEAHGLVDGQPTSKHFDLLIYDDVVTRESVNTPDQIQKTTEAWELSDNLGTMGGRKWIIGTRYHYADTYFEIIKRGAARPRIYPATSNGQIDGMPVLFTAAEWQRRVRDQGEATVACQLLANPLAGHQRMFNVEDLQVYEVRPLTMMGYLLVDPARSMKRDSANTAMVVLGISGTGNKYLLDGFDHKMDLMERWNNMRDLWELWNRAPGFQGFHVGYEKYGADADLDYFKERQQIERCHFEISPLEWPRSGERSKEDRVQRLVPDIRGHRFYVPHPTHEDRLTKLQVKTIAEGYEFLLSRRIRGKDENNVIYDLLEHFKMQVSYFPFGGRVDVIDAVSRIYDLEPAIPERIDESELEPEVL